MKTPLSRRNLLALSIFTLVGSVHATSAQAASVCTNSSGNLVFNDSNIVGGGSIWIAGYNNGQWMWNSDATCSAGQCVSDMAYSGGQVEFRLEGPGIANYYSPATSGTMYPLTTPTSCSGGSSATPTPAATPVPTPVATPEPTPVATATPEATPEATATPVATPEPTEAPTSGASTTLVEAESGSAYGGAQTYNDGAASGGSGMAYISTVGAGFSLTNVPASDSLDITYASQNSGQISVSINGSDAGNIAFSSTGSWVSSYATVSHTISIPANATVDISFDSGDAGLNIDYLEFHSSGSGTTPSEPEATPEPTPTPVVGGKPAIPADGQRYFILGQDQVSIQDYMLETDLPRPIGFTMYITLARGEMSTDGYCFKGLDGLKNVGSYNSNSAAGCADNGHRQNHWGSGIQNVQWAIESYTPQIMSIGLWCPSNDNMPALYNNNAYDDLLTELADFFKQHDNVSFFLRTCYEFNGDAGGWSQQNLRETFKYVRTYLDNQNVTNVAHVWQSDAYHSTGRTTSTLGDTEQGYWPGKQYVDWVGSSQFHSDVGEEAAIAEAEGLPHFIAESTPHGALGHQYAFGLNFNSTGSSPDGTVTLHNDLDWFNQKNAEVTRTSTKAWHYINANWNDQPQWGNAADQAGVNYFKYTDSRIQLTTEIREHFKAKVTAANGFLLGN